MTVRAEASDVKRASIGLTTLQVLSVVAGAFVSFRCNIRNDGQRGAADLPYGIVRLLVGLVFSAGLTMGIIGGAELFTRTTSLSWPWASNKVTTSAVLLNWVLSFAGNFVGAIAERGADVQLNAIHIRRRFCSPVVAEHE